MKYNSQILQRFFKYFKFCYILTNCRLDTFTLTKPPGKTSNTMHFLKIFSYILIHYTLCYIREMLEGATQRSHSSLTKKGKEWGRENIENPTFAIDTRKTGVSITQDAISVNTSQYIYIYIFIDHKKSTDSFLLI